MSNAPSTDRTGLIICGLLLLAGLLVFSRAGSDLAQMDFAAPPPAPATEGDPAPTFELEALEGAPVALQDLRGQVVLINFWATWCGPCKLEMPHIQELHDQYAAQGLTVLGITTDHVLSQVAPFIERHGFTFPILFADGQVQMDYQVRGIPSLYLVDRQGAIRYRQVGFNPAIVPRLKQEVADLLAE